MREKKNAEEPLLSPEEMRNRKNRRRKVALSAVLLIIYVIVMPWIGFVLSTLLYVLAFIIVLEERRKWVLISSPFLITALVIVVFSKFIVIPFPRGMGLFAAFSRFFY
jgi:putative tricarboxylic transport membrane protein